MGKILVIGCPGAGKSTFSRKLAELLSIPLYPLDMVWFSGNGREHISREEFDGRLSELMSGEEWIIDGNYSRTMEWRMSCCDTVFFFDLPTEVCLNGMASRIGIKCPDRPWVETAIDPAFRERIINFRKDLQPYIEQLLEKYSETITIMRFNSRGEVDTYLNNRATLNFGIIKNSMRQP